MKKSTSFLIWIALCLLCSACAGFFQPRPTGLCLPCFPDKDGWYGGDGAYSIALDERRTLWLFGDTFVSDDIDRKDRIGMDVVMGNTLAVSTCSPEQLFSIRYYLKKRNATFVPFFGEKEILWPQDPFIVNNVLYIPLLVIQGLPDAPAPFNFKIAGQKIARIQDYASTDPRNWPVEYLDWTAAIPPGIDALATTAIVHGDYIYFYPLYRYQGQQGNILMRLPANRIDQPVGAFEFLNRDKTWSNELMHQTIDVVFPAAVSELSVRFHPQRNNWLAVYLSPAEKGRRLLAQTADKLEGPWSTPVPLIESIQERDPSSPLFDPDTFCYAGKEHRQFGDGNTLVITYVCNFPESPQHPASFLRRNLILYRPVVSTPKMP